MSQIAQCTTIEEKQLVTKQNLDLLRRLYNGENATIEGTKYNLGDTLKTQYGDIDSESGRRMFEIIVDRGTYKPAIDSFTGFTDGDFRRIKNELIREARNLKNPKISVLEKNLFVRRGVMNKYAITKYINGEINNAANYERTQFSTFLKANQEIMKLLKADAIMNRGDTRFRLGVKSVSDLEKLENDLTIAANNPQSPEQAQRVMEISNQMAEIFKSDGGMPLQELRMFLEGELEQKNGAYFKYLDDGTRVQIADEVVKAGKIGRRLLNDMGDVLINGLKQHKKVIRQSYLNSTKDSALLLPNGDKVKRYEETIDSQIKAVQEGVKGGNYFPHYLIESFLNVEKIMDNAEKNKYQDIDSDLNDLTNIFTKMSNEIGTPKSALFRGDIAFENYQKNPMAVLRKYSLDAIAFNKTNYLKNIMFEGLRGLPKDSDVAQGLGDYILDTYTVAEKGYSDRPSWVNKTVRTLTGVQFLSKLGFGIGTAARNTLSGMYYLQGVGNRAFVKYLREYELSKDQKIYGEEGKEKSLADIITAVEKEQGFKFEDMASPLFTEGLVQTEGVRQKDIEVKQDGDGNFKLQYKDGKNWRAFDSVMTSAAGKGAIFQRVTENFLRKHMFRYSFISKFKEMKSGGLKNQQSINIAKKHALDMVNKYAFEYSPSQKAPIIGGTKSGLGAFGQVAFQFMHYPMSFLQLQSEVLRKSKDAVIAGQWDSPDLHVPLRFAGLYLFTEMMSGVLNLDLQRLMENDTVERIKTLKQGLEGEDVKGRGFLGPTVGELFYYSTLFDWVKTPDNLAAQMIVGYNDAYGLTDEQKRARLLSSLNVQASKFINKDYKALRTGNGWDLLMHEFGLYPNKRTREMRRAEPLRTLLPPVKKKKKSKKNQPVIDSKKNPQEELTKLYRAMGI
tara:strand:- start:1481 stop:4180 length:2700 start_codon:yes stop_codon:yes gene_type:complete